MHISIIHHSMNESLLSPMMNMTFLYEVALQQTFKNNEIEWNFNNDAVKFFFQLPTTTKNLSCAL